MIAIARAFRTKRRVLSPVSLTRFDQQQTTRWHVDGGPDASVLVLGYEPTEVRSEVYVCDLGRVAARLGTDLVDAAMRAQRGECDPWIAELGKRLPLRFDDYPIVVLNNSVDRSGGVLHRARVEAKPSASRVVNSALFALAERAEWGDEAAAFLTANPAP
ncbi:MAG: hypothetical protein AAGE52_23755 [Myxococcota bacterium]